MLRIGTFNCENLFSRSLALSTDSEADEARLERVAELNKLIAKAAYSADDKARMRELLGELKGVVTINELRERFLKGQEVVANGRGDWIGGIELVDRPVPLNAQLNTARVIDEIAADIQVVVEVEDRHELELFNAKLAKPFRYNMLVEGNDSRGIDVGLLSRYPIVSLRSHIFDLDDANKRLFSRDCLEVDVELESGAVVHLLINHLKSKSTLGGTTSAQNDALRRKQAERVSAIVDRYNLETDLVVVVGDFNDTPDSPPLSALTQRPDLVSVLDRIADPQKRAWTYYSKGFGGSQIDYMLVSKPLAAKLGAVSIERRGIAELASADQIDAAGQPISPFDNITALTAASDHAAIVAEFGDL